MLFNFYAETSFTDMCGRGYFGVHLRLQKCRLHLQLSNDRHPRTSMDGRGWSFTSSNVSTVLCERNE